MTVAYVARCTCGAVELSINGRPIVHAFCHCVDCRELLNLPYHPVTAWLAEDVSISDPSGKLTEYEHSELEIKRMFWSDCGEVLFNTNSTGWSVISKHLIAKCNDGELPEELRSNKHFFYEQRVIDIADGLPKFLRGSDGPQFEEV